MSPEDRQAYEVAWATAVKRMPKRHVVHHAIWRDGQLTVMSGPPQRAAEDKEPPARQRGVQAELFG